MSEKRRAIATIATDTIGQAVQGITTHTRDGYVYRGFLGDSTDVNPSAVRFAMEHSDSILIIADHLPVGTTLVACAWEESPEHASDLIITNCCLGGGAFKVIGESTQWTPMDLGGEWSITRADDGKYTSNMMLVPLITRMGFAIYHNDTKELVQAGDMREAVVRFVRTKAELVVPADAWPGRKG